MTAHYYEDERITYDEADEEVQRYVEASTQRLVTAREVCKQRGIEPTDHNQRRVLEALEERCELSEEWSSAVNKYEIEP